MSATCRSFDAARLAAFLTLSITVIPTVTAGCSTPTDRTTGGTTAAPTAQPSAAVPFTPADDVSIEARARETEAKMTDDERFALLVSLIGAVPSIGVPRDTRIPDTVTNMSAGYTPGLPRLGIPALQSSDASMGVTNPGYRP